MPAYRKKNRIPLRRYRRRKTFKKKLTVPRSMRQPTYSFIRKYQYILNPSEITGTTPNPYGWLQGVGSTGFGIQSGQGIQQTFAMSLSSLVNYTEFTRLFRFHKITAYKMEFIPSCNTTLAGSGSNVQNTDAANGPHSVNNSLILRTARNQSGYTLVNTSGVADWLQRTGVKKMIIPTNRKTTVFMKTNLTGNLTGDYPSVVRPRWIPTSNFNTPFYGLDIRMDSVNGDDLAAYNGFPQFTVHVTAYLKFKGTQ